MENNNINKPLFEYENRLVVMIDDETQVELKTVSDDKLWPYNKLKLTSSQLRKYNIYPIAGIFRKGKCAKTATSNNPIYGIFKSEKCVKVYRPRPLSGESKFIHYGIKPTNFIFGWEQLPESGKICFINAGEKDAKVMSEVIGYPSISPNSENSYSNITEKHIEELKERFGVVCVMFDNDKTGIEFSQKICNRYKLLNIRLPEIENGKDLSDYVEKGMSIDELKDIIEKIVQEPDPIWDDDINTSKTTLQTSKVESKNDNQELTDLPNNIEALYSGFEDAIDIILEEASKKHTFEEGNRNSYALYVSSVSNTRGIPLKILLNRLEKEINISAFPEHLKTVTGTYERYKDQYASHPFKDFELYKKHETPVINKDICEKLPLVLKNFLSRFNDIRERDVAAYGFLSLLGAILKGYTVIHKNQGYYTNLFIVIAAPFASGKGVLSTIREIGEKLQKRLLSISAERQKLYKAEMESFKKGELEKEPIEPILPLLFLPGDMSSAACKDYLSDSGGMGMIFDTETDTISTTFSQEWGDYSVLIRKGLSNEVIEFARKGILKEIEKPFLSGLISGTIGALFDFIPNSQNGLFSRIIYYTYSKKPEFATDAFGHMNYNLNKNQKKQLEEFVEKVYFYFQELEEKNQTIHFYWEETYQKKLVRIYTDWLNSHVAIMGEDGARVLFRLANISSRLAAILTIYRLMESNGKVDPNNLDLLFTEKKNVMITCNKIDFEITCHLMDVFRQHTMHLFENLKDESINKPLKSLQTSKLNLWHILPNKFKRDEATEIGKHINQAKRTVDKYLKEFCDLKLMERDEKGNYIKLK